MPEQRRALVRDSQPKILQLLCATLLGGVGGDNFIWFSSTAPRLYTSRRQAERLIMLVICSQKHQDKQALK